jgi:hypothetical protein
MGGWVNVGRWFAERLRFGNFLINLKKCASRLLGGQVWIEIGFDLDIGGLDMI